MTALKPGTGVGRFQITHFLGGGGPAAVYEAVDPARSDPVALKVFVAGLSGLPDFRRRLQRDAAKLSSLDHPHIPAVYELGKSRQGLYLSMALVRGSSLQALIGTEELTRVRVLEILTAVADALDRAHQAGLQHGHLGPGKILLAADTGRPFLVGLATTHLLGQIGASTALRLLAGSPAHLSPEQIMGKPTGARSDVYSLATILFEAFAGSPPFAGESNEAIAVAHLGQPAPAVTASRADLPSALDGILQGAMAKDPERRPGSAGELLEAVAHAFDVSHTAPARPGTTRPRRRPGSSSTPPPARPAGKPAVGRSSQRGSPRSGPRRVDERRSARIPTAPTPTPSVAQPTPIPSVAQPTPLPAAAAAGRRRGSGPSSWWLLGRAWVARRGRGTRISVAGAVATALLALMAAAAGWYLPSIGSAADEQPPAPPPSVRFEAPSGWRALEPPPVRTLALADAVGLAPVDAGRASGLVAGEVPSELALSRFLESFERTAPSKAVMLGRLSATRRTGFSRPNSKERLALYTVSTTKGRVAVVCFAPTATAADFLPSCERVAQSLELAGLEARPARASDSYARALSGAVGRLNERRRALDTTFKRARTREGQAKTASRLAREHRVAAATLARPVKTAEERRADAAIVGALTDVAAAYDRLATSARAGDRGRYARAGLAARRAEALLNRHLERLVGLGYRIA